MKSALIFFKNIFLSVIFGKIVFFGFVLAPRVFKVLPHDLAAKLQNSLFPSYYFLDLISFIGLGVILFVFKNAVFSKSYQKSRAWRWTQTFYFIGLLISLYSYYFMLPEMLSLYQSGASADRDAFQWFHKLSVSLNSGILFLSATLMASSVEKVR